MSGTRQRLLVLEGKAKAKAVSPDRPGGFRAARWLQASSIAFSTCLCLEQELTSSFTATVMSSSALLLLFQLKSQYSVCDIAVGCRDNGEFSLQVENVQ
ncbi:unnamed protein product [Coccothraustes coccothraustes]